MIKKNTCVLIFLFFVITFANASGVLARPRKVYEIKTQYFDILFSEESKEVADYLSKNADALYEKAKSKLNSDAHFRMPVVISPDSDVLSVEYTSQPYNRIVVFDAVSNEEQLVFSNPLEELFYHEVFDAIAMSKMDKFNKFIHNTIGGDTYLPVSLINLPFSFVHGFGYWEENSENAGRLSDAYFLQILSQAKLEKKFPKWIDITVVPDVEPTEELSIAAASAFTAFLINQYGIEKYAEFWEECGKIHAYFAAGIFKKVYKQKIEDVWTVFEDSVPLPDDLEKIEYYEQTAQKLFSEADSNYENIIFSPYGLIWYDSIRHEVDIYKDKRKKLFYADEVERLDLSDDGRYLAISYISFKNYEVFKKYQAEIYDLKNQNSICRELNLRDVTFVKLASGQTAIAGINVEAKISELKVIELKALGAAEDKTVYSKLFERNTVPVNPVCAGDGKILYIISKNKNQCLVSLEIETEEEKYFQINQSKKIKNLRRQKKGDEVFYTFNFIPKEETAFTRMGYFSLSETGDIEKISFQNGDVSGGVNFPVFVDDKIYFSSKKMAHDELVILPFDEFSFTDENGDGRLVEGSGMFEYYQPDLSEITEKIKNKELKKYYPVKYLYHLTVLPFFPVKTISMDEGPLFWPGLGVTIRTKADPFNNNELLFSASWNYLKLNFKWNFSVPDKLQQLMDIDSEIGDKNKSFVLFFENTSTPVDIKTAAFLRYNFDGEYDFNTMVSTSWKIPLGMDFRKLNFNIQGSYNASTDYFDVNMRDAYKSKKDWPSFNDSYVLIEASSTIEYTDLHQSGLSAFEQAGFKVGVRVYSMWDMYTIKMQEKEKEAAQEAGISDKIFNRSFDLNITQLNIALYGMLAIPKLLPIDSQNDWIFSAPTTLSAEVMNKTGTAIQLSTSTLIFGKEIHHGVPFWNLFFNRLGLKGGYTFYLNYDTQKVALPDIRTANYYDVIFENSFIQHEFYLLFDMDWMITIGQLSKTKINTQFKASYYPDTNGFMFDLNFECKF